MRRGFAIALILPLWLLFYSAPANAGADYGFTINSPATPFLAPDFTLPHLDGDIPKLSLSSLRGRVVLIHFWASWCRPCKEEFPALMALSERFAGRGLTVVAVAEDSRKRALPFIRELSPDFPVVIDRYGSVKGDYNARLLPTTVVIDRSGMIAGTINGPADFSSSEALRFLEALLEEKGGD